MPGARSRQVPGAVLLADADVLIDYAKSDPEVLALVAEHVGPLMTVSLVLDEVNELEAGDCARLGLGVVEATTEQLLRAASAPSRASFTDRVCFVVCLDRGWTCVTNDRGLQRLCQENRVTARFGLGLVVDLVAAGAISRGRAETVAQRIHAQNPDHINDRVIRGFLAALDRVVRN